jgi:Domain of unknown function (DUF4191)
MSKMGDRVRTIRENYRMAKENDPKLSWILLGILVAGLIITIILMVAVGNPITWAIIGISLILVVESIVFSRRAMSAAYRSIEGKPGAAVAIVQSQSLAKRGWGVTPAVAVNKSQDLVHRAVGRPGVVLIGEGATPALPSLMNSERKRTARFIGEMPITDVVIGKEEGQVPIAKLEKHLRKLPNVLSGSEASDLRKRLDALGAAPLPMPKGPIPRSGRMPRGGKMR